MKMTKAKWVRFIELVAAAFLGSALALYRASLARGGELLKYGGMSYSIGFLAIFIGVVVFGFFALSVSLYKHQRLKDSQTGVAYRAVNALAGLGMIAAAALLFWEQRPDLSVIVMVQMAFLAISGIGVLLLAIKGDRGGELLTLFPVYYFCLCIMLFYRENAKNPSVISFGMEILVLSATALALYILSARHFENGRGSQRLFLCLTAVFFISFELMSLAFYPELVLSIPGITVSRLAMLAAFGLYICGGLFAPPRPEPVVQAVDDEAPEVNIGSLSLEPGATVYLEVDVDITSPELSVDAPAETEPRPSSESEAMRRYPKRGKYFEGEGPAPESSEDTQLGDLFNTVELSDIFAKPWESPKQNPDDSAEAEPEAGDAQV